MKLGSIHQKLDKGQGRDAKSRQESAEYLDQLLATVPFRKSTEELTKISFPRETTLSGSQISDVDTDNDDIDKLDAVKLGKKRKKPYNASRLLYSTKEGSVDNCLQQRDLLPPDEIGEDSRQTAQQHMQKLCRRLVLDALRIVEAHPREQTRASTVCLCVVLRNKDGYAKRFVFHNGASSLPLLMRKKASHLKYHIIHAEHAHAEGEFVQFLLKRNTKEEAETYTHVIGMGCSRQHCPECNCLLKLALGESYYNFTASLSDNRDEKEQVEVKLSPDIENQVLIDRSCQGTVPILYGANASSSKYFRQFSLKKMLSTWIGTITNIQIPNMERYNNADDAQQSGA